MIKYLWIPKYKNIEVTGFNFSNSETFNFIKQNDREEDKVKYFEGDIEISPINNINIFEDQSVTNISLIVGENGSGKSSILEYVYSAIFSDWRYFNGIIVIDKFIIASDNISINNLNVLQGYEFINSEEELMKRKKISGANDLSIKEVFYRDSFLFFYSPFLNLDRVSDFEGYSGENERFENGTLFDISSAGQLINDYNSNFLYYNKSDLSTINPLINHRSLEVIRYIKHLIKHSDSSLFQNKIEKIKFILNDYNSSYWYKVSNMFINDEINDQRNLIDEFEHEKKLNDFQNKFYKEVFFFLLYQLYNLIRNGNKIETNSTVHTLKIAFNLFKKVTVNNYKDAVNELLNNSNFSDLKDSNVFEEIFNLFNTSEKKEDGFILNYSEKKLIEIIYNALYNNRQLIIRDNGFILNIFNIEFIGLSSGEKSLLSLFSRLENKIDILKSREQHSIFSLRDKKITILLDEPEIGLHPQWQKEYISRLLEYIKTTFTNNPVQIILTTHSPILLSDFPFHHITYLEKDENGVCKKVEGEKQSFAANIYDLYNSSFFLRNGFIGSFAIAKINSILKKDIIENDDIEVINLIGDPFLKGVINKQIENKISNDILSKEIERLQEIQKKRFPDATN